MAPNKLAISLTPNFFGLFDLGASDGKYNVLSTDYSTYSIVYTCSEWSLWFLSVRNEYAWVLGRESDNAGNGTFDAALEILDGYTDIKRLEAADQDC